MILENKIGLHLKGDLALKNILVTGGCGFMGSHFVELLLSQDIEKIIIIDKLSYAGNMKNVEKALKNPKCKFYLSDIAHPEIAHILRVEKIDTIVNFAAETHVDRSITHPKAFLETDILGLFNLAYWAMKTRVKTFLQISTDEVYGSIEKGEADELYPLNPTSPYSASKAAGELLLQSYHKTYGLPLIIVRCCNNFGPRQYPEKLIPMVITRVLNKKLAFLHGEGAEQREWIYVKNCAERILETLLCRKIGGIYNIGSGFRGTNEQLIKLIISNILLPKGYCISYDDMNILFNEWVEKISNRPNNDKRYAINCDNFKKNIYPFLNYKQETGEQYLWDTIEWYKNNPDWWEGVVDLDSNLYKKGESLR